MPAMISRIEGDLVRAGEEGVELRCGDVTYGLAVPAADAEGLARRVGERLEFHTLHYLESQGQGNSFVPRLIGFRSRDARAFFEMLTTVKGLGARKALRVLRLPFAKLAEAIARKDVDLLRTLPEIGRRTAETIVAELHGNVDRFFELKPAAGPGDPETGPPAVVRDAVAALARLGESRQEARRLVERALADDPTLATADAVVAAAYRVQQAG